MTTTTSFWIGAAWTQLWQVTLLVMAIGLIARFACQRRPHLAHLLWILVFIKCLTPPVWSSPTGVFGWLQSSNTPVSIKAMPVADIVDPPEFATATFPTLEPQQTKSAELIQSTPLMTSPSASVSVPLVIATVWLTGAFLLGAFLFVKWLRFRRLLSQSAVPADSALAAMAGGWARKLGLRRPVRLLVLRDPVGPASIGLLAPAVLMPQAIVQDKSPSEIEPILVHELVHIRRGDHFIGLIQLLAQIVWWFHPLVWWASREASRECERCCDEEAVAELGCAPTTYARCLLDVVAQKQLLQPAFAWPGMRPAQVTASRLRTIMNRTRPLQRRTPRWCWFLMLVTAACVLPGGERVDGRESSLPTRQAEQKSAYVPDAHASNFLVYPVTTELQHAILKSVGGVPTQVYVRINANAVFKTNGEVDEGALNLDGLAKVLKTYSEKNKSALYFGISGAHETDGPALPPAKKDQVIFNDKLIEWGKSQGFRTTQVKSRYTRSTLDYWTRSFETNKNAQAGEPEGAEPSVGNDLLKIYPVRTALTRFLTVNSDCVVEILPIINGSLPNALGTELYDALVLHLAKLDLKKKHKLLLVFQWDSGSTAEERKKLVTTHFLRDVREKLGFDEVSIHIDVVGKKGTPDRPPGQDRSKQPEPSSGARPLSELIDDLKSQDLQVRKKAADAIGALGPQAKSAVPALLDAIAKKDPYGSPEVALWKVDRARYIEILKDKSDPHRWSLILSCGAVGAEAKELAPTLIAIAKDPKDSPNREHAMLSLGRIGADPDVVVPVLIESLQVGQYARSMSSQALGQIGPAAKAALPALHRLLTDEDSRVRVEAAGAIWKIEKEAKDVLPVLESALTETTPSTPGGAHYPAIVYLGQMGPAAKPAFATLLKLWREDGKNPQGTYAAALKAIDPEAAARAGVK